MSGQSSVRKMSCLVKVMSGKCVQEFELEPFKRGVKKYATVVVGM